MARSKKAEVKARDIAKVLTDAKFNPGNHGPWSIIVEAGTPAYYKLRAIEAIKSNDLKLAIQLLALAEATDGMISLLHRT